MLKTPLLIIILLLQIALIGMFLVKYPDTTDQLQKKYDDLGSKSSMDSDNKNATEESPQISNISSSNPQINNSLSSNESGSEVESKNINNSSSPTDNLKSSEQISSALIH